MALLPEVLADDAERGPWQGVPPQESVRLLTLLLRCANAAAEGALHRECVDALERAVAQGRFRRGVGAAQDVEGARIFALADDVLHGRAEAIGTADLAALYARCIPPDTKLPHLVTTPDGRRASWFVPDAARERWTSCLDLLQPLLRLDAGADLLLRGPLPGAFGACGAEGAEAAAIRAELDAIKCVIAIVQAQHAKRGCPRALSDADRRPLLHRLRTLVDRAHRQWRAADDGGRKGSTDVVAVVL